MLLGVGLLIGAISLAGCGYVYRSGFVRVPRQPISGPVEIGPEWIELIPPSPLIPYGTYQSVRVGIQNYDRKNTLSDETGEVLNLADGGKTRIELIVFDDHGQEHKMQITGTGGVGGGISFTPKYVPTIIDGKPDKLLPKFPPDRRYVKITIRSHIRLNADQVEWVGSNNK